VESIWIGKERNQIKEIHVRIDVFGKNNTRMSIEFKFVAEYVKLSEWD
jgi:hypothetical protein